MEAGLKTKFVLGGGFTWKASDGGKAYLSELLSKEKRTTRILLCCFAKPIEKWQEALSEDVALFQKMFGEGVVDITLADSVTFAKQVAGVDTVYFKGGSTQDLLANLRESGDWQQNLVGKTVAGTSAGVDALTAYHYDIDDLRVTTGLGLLPMKSIVHYRSDYNSPNVNWDEAERELECFGEELPILKIREGEFTIV